MGVNLDWGPFGGQHLGGVSCHTDRLVRRFQLFRIIVVEPALDPHKFATLREKA